MVPLVERFPHSLADPETLRTWLCSFLELQRRYTGVMRAWVEASPRDRVVLLGAAWVSRAIDAAVVDVFGPSRRYPLSSRATSILFTALLEHFPNEGIGTVYAMSDAAIVDAQARFVRRVIVPVMAS